MSDLLTNLQYQNLTATVTKFRWPQFWFVNQIPTEPVDGTIAQWDIEVPVIDMNTDFTTLNGEAQPTRMGAYGTRTQKMPITFKFITMDPGILMQLRAIGQIGNASRAQRGQEYVAREQMAIQRRFGSYLDEYLISQALTGTLNITVNGQAVSINYGLPSSHTPTYGNGAWSNPSTDLTKDLTAWKRLIRKDTGLEPRWAICNQTVMNMLLNNSNIKSYMQYGSGVEIASSGQIVKYHGLQWIVLDHHYAQANAVDRFDTPFIADNQLFIVPDITPEWITMQKGTVIIPNAAHNDTVEVNGPVMWGVVTDNPTGLTLYYKYARLPAIKLPNAIVYAQVA